MKIFLERRQFGWRGATEEDNSKFERLNKRMEVAAVGSAMVMEVKRPRNLVHHRKGMALLRYVFENQSKYKNIEDLLVELKLRCGHYQEHITLDGEIVLVPKSIAFSELDQDSFDELYEKMVQVAITHLLPIMNKGDEAQHLENISRF